MSESPSSLAGCLCFQAACWERIEMLLASGILTISKSSALSTAPNPVHRTAAAQPATAARTAVSMPAGGRPMASVAFRVQSHCTREEGVAAPAGPRGIFREIPLQFAGTGRSAG